MAERYLRLNRDVAATAFSLNAGSPCARQTGPRAGSFGHVDVVRRGAADWTLRYNINEIDADGRAKVFWDADLWALAPGWYLLEVWLGCSKCAEVLALLGDECGVSAAESQPNDCAMPCEDCTAPVLPPGVPSEVPAYTPAYFGALNLKG